MNKVIANALREKKQKHARSEYLGAQARPSSVLLDEAPPAQPAAQPAPQSPLTVAEKREKLAEFVSQGYSPADAARAVGYSPTNASTVMRTEEVQAYLAKARAELTSISTVKRCDVLDLFLEAADMARTLADPQALIAAGREIGKMLGFYEPEKLTVEVSGSVAVMAEKFKQMSDEELLAIAAGEQPVYEGEARRLQ